MFCLCFAENLGSHHTMEINPPYSDLQRKDQRGTMGFLGGLAGTMLPSPPHPPHQGPLPQHPQGPTPQHPQGPQPQQTSSASPASAGELQQQQQQQEHLQFQQQLLALKQEQQVQQQLLLQHYQRQQQQLAQQHEKQLQERIKEYLDHQRQLQEEHKLERERQEKDRQLDQLRKKDKHEQSAIASSEVKQRLQEFVLSKKQREAAANSANTSPPNFRNWSRQRSSLDQASPPSTSAVSPQCRHPLLGKYDDDFPLRKTASEPNLKVRSVLKQKVIERRSSPLLRRKDKGPVPLKRRPLTIDGCNSKPDSLEGSPPNGSLSLHSSLHSSNGSTPIQEEPGNSPYHPLSQGGTNDLTLYSSPSMPNISLGRPPVPSSSADGKILNSVSEAQVRAMAAARLGMPLTSHVLHSSLPFCSPLPVIDGEFTPPTSPGYIQQQMKGLEQSPGQVLQVMYPPGTVITDAHVAQARLHRTIHRPLGRTQSAPLPLGHPMLQPQGVLINAQLYEQQQQHNLLKQHIRQTVLTRAGSKSQVVEHVEEETEAAVAQEMKDQPEVIDLTDTRKAPSSENPLDPPTLLLLQRQQQRDLVARHSLHVGGGEGSAFTPRHPHGHHGARPLSRALSSPLVSLSPPGGSPQTQQQEAATMGNPGAAPGSSPPRVTTGLAYDSLMLKHQCICGDYSSHPEHGGRLQSIWARLQETGLAARCERIRSRKATLEEIQSCHDEGYAFMFGTNPLNRQKLEMSKLELPIKSFVMLPCGGIGVDSDTTWNELHTASAARMATGCVIELSFKVATGEAKNGFAMVRPPGHHAEFKQAMGFCFFNSVAIAAKQLRQKLKMEKILVIDWDVHHGNGLQQIFYDDPHVLYVSLHRHDDGNFFPGTGDPQEVGVEDGTGFNVNIAWSGTLNPPMGDAEYIAAFRTIVMPIARDFDPEIVLVAAGFDAAAGHPPPLGGYQISPACFAYMTKQLMTLAKGKVVLALEGGYDLPSICDCSQECVAALLGDEVSPLREEEVTRQPCGAAVQVLQRTAAIQAPHWPCIKKWAPTIGSSLLDAQQKDKEEVETVTALASLSMAVQMHGPKSEPPQEDEPMEEDQDK
ncbi:histone deacetylase 4 isoform X1 [Ixodes scapularis]|uniref:histone deacetylase 4 isoform X1 n=1 Tax=Ixodes scapularis TaxID=6945 RepID=UPI001C382F9F|nr:histone deacetylase 4 isoform X1 [Ixodes scapularis]